MTGQRLEKAVSRLLAVLGSLCGNADAELLRLDVEHDRVFASAHSGIDDADLDSACERLANIEFAMHAIPAQTMAGLAVKARVAREHISPRNPECRSLDDIVGSLIDDLLVLGEAPPKRSGGGPARSEIET